MNCLIQKYRSVHFSAKGHKHPLAALVVALMALGSFNAFAAPREIWVSPNGSDSAAGTKQAPFLTLQHAHDELSKIPGDKTDKSDVVVYLADGTHRLTKPLVFDAQHFGPNGPAIKFRAAPGANPVISGAVQVTGWSLHDKTLNIWQASVGTNYSRHLYVNGKRATRARTESSNGYLPAGFRPQTEFPESPDACPYVLGGGIDFMPTALNPAGWRDPGSWGNPQYIEAVIKTQWKMMSVPLQSITPAPKNGLGHITLQQPAWTNANIYFSSKTHGPGIWSFWQVTYFENAYEFLDQPGEWYLDKAKGMLYYIPRAGENLATADVELPVVEMLVEGIGTPEQPVANIGFEGVTFAYATWLEPGGCQRQDAAGCHSDGYVDDQSGFHLTGDKYHPNITGHAKDVERTPGNLRFRYARNISFKGNRFQHMGAVALDFDTGSQDNEITGNTFTDISSAAIQLGGVGQFDHHPVAAAQYTRHNTISNNLITQAGREYVDAAGIFIGFTQDTLVSHNTISEVPWAGIAIGWGWGLLDKGMFPGAPDAASGMWGTYRTPTPNSHNRITYNDISRFVEDRWDGGAIYSTGQQGQSMDDPLLIEGNVVHDKRANGGSNIFYTDGGSRYVKLKRNASYRNPIGYVDLGPPPQKGDPLPYPDMPFPPSTITTEAVNLIHYGGDTGGCRTYGDISYEDNYWVDGLKIPLEEISIGLTSWIATDILTWGHPFDPYSKHGFFDVCPYTQNGVSYPANLTYSNNHDVWNVSDVPQDILKNAGVQK